MSPPIVKWLNQAPLEPSTVGSACFDLKAKGNYQLMQGEPTTVSTGLSVEIPEGHYMQVLSRSGLAAKNGVFVVNAPGIIDSDYRGEIKVIMSCLSGSFQIQDGDRIAQAIILPAHPYEHKVVEELSATARGEKGLGSTGK